VGEIEEKLIQYEYDLGVSRMEENGNDSNQKSSSPVRMPFDPETNTFNFRSDKGYRRLERLISIMEILGLPKAQIPQLIAATWNDLPRDSELMELNQLAQISKKHNVLITTDKYYELLKTAKQRKIRILNLISQNIQRRIKDKFVYGDKYFGNQVKVHLFKKHNKMRILEFICGSSSCGKILAC